MSKPFFFVAGAQRSGTSYLYNMLNQHPQICMAKPEKPEPKFFLNSGEYEKGKNYYLNKYYKDTSEILVFGEKSTSYIESKAAAERIKGMFQDAKIIFIIRNPVSRAISNYFFSVANGLERRTIHEVFIEKKPVDLAYSTSVSPFKYIDRGEYTQYLPVYYDIFGVEKIKIILFEDMIENDDFVKEVFQFLQVDDDFGPQSLSMKVNANDTYHVEENIIRDLNLYFRPHNEKLQKMLGIDLSKWA